MAAVNAQQLSADVWERRLLVYPQLVLCTVWAVVICNAALSARQNGFGPPAGSDFITLYSAGLLSRENPAGLYDLFAQGWVQGGVSGVVAAEGVNPFISPPHVAWALGALTLLPLPAAYFFWLSLSLLLVLGALRLMAPWSPLGSAGRRITPLAVLVYSFLPLVQGWRVGQNHCLSLFLCAALAAAI